MKTEFEKKEFIKHINLLNSNFFEDTKVVACGGILKRNCGKPILIFFNIKTV